MVPCGSGFSGAGFRDETMLKRRPTGNMVSHNAASDITGTSKTASSVAIGIEFSNPTTHAAETRGKTPIVVAPANAAAKSQHDDGGRCRSSAATIDTRSVLVGWVAPNVSGTLFA
jgi:hypothetical protein